MKAVRWRGRTSGRVVGEEKDQVRERGELREAKNVANGCLCFKSRLYNILKKFKKMFNFKSRITFSLKRHFEFMK